MKIIITGSCGHIGSYIVENLPKIKKIKTAILIDNLESNRFNSIFNLKNKPKFFFFQRDLTNKKSLNDFKNVDLIIHCASITTAAASFKNKKQMYSNNIECMRNVINYCKKNKSKLIHISSTSIYGKSSNLVNESDTHLIKPQSPYADIKLIEEKMLHKIKREIKYVSFRFGTITGISKGMRFHTAINQFCLNASLNNPIKIYKGAYDQYRPYLTLGDTFKTLKFVIENKKLFGDKVAGYITPFTMEIDSKAELKLLSSYENNKYKK